MFVLIDMQMIWGFVVSEGRISFFSWTGDIIESLELEGPLKVFESYSLAAYMDIHI